ncbi:MAG: hypothetical protein O3A01_05720, partial [bacterium]|nr:hypothetical protein [bacterium]
QGGNVGYSPEGLFVEEEPVNGYRITDQGYDDQLMREAVRVTPVEKYCLVGNNCQDWADAVRDSYHRLESQN